jgi:hypothetical protein
VLAAEGVWGIVTFVRLAAWIDGTTLTRIGAFGRRSVDLARVRSASVRIGNTVGGPAYARLVLTGGGSLRRLDLLRTLTRPLPAGDLEALAAALERNPDAEAVAQAVTDLRDLI